jgi:hypothetical protein
MIFRIFNKKTNIITYFTLNVYLENIDKNDTENYKKQPVYLQQASHNKTQP